MQQETTKKRSWVKKSAKVLLWTTIVLTLTLGIAYWTAPSWVPGQVQKFLPESVQIENLTLKRPGLTSTQIDTLTINLGQETQYQIQLSNVTLGYSLWRRELTSIEANIAHLKWPQGKQEQSSSELLESIPLPVLPVADISLDKLTIEGLTLQHIIAKNIVLEENGDSLFLTSKVHFLEKDFDIQATAKRNNGALSSIDTTITQHENQLQLSAVPVTSKLWQLQSKGTLSVQELYPQPGITPITFVVDGSVNIAQDALILELEPSTQFTSAIDIQALQLNQDLEELLSQYSVKTNFAQLDPNYRISVHPITSTSLSYFGADSKVSLEQGQLGVKLSNPAVNADLQLKQLQLNLEQALTDETQEAGLSGQFSIKELEGRFDSPEHTASTKKVELEMKTELILASSILDLNVSNGTVSQEEIHYQGNNSIASINPSQWQFQGSSRLDLSKPEESRHQWALKTQEALNGKLELSNEQFTANKISANLKFLQNKQQAQGKLSGHYQISSLSLKQQPLQLDGIKGELNYVLSKTPTGKLKFSNARYNSSQIGVSGIAGQLDWNKKPSAFTATGHLTHDKSKIPFNYSFNLESSKHNLKVAQSSLPISTVTSWLNVLKDYPQLSFNSGQLEIDSLDGDPIGLLFDGKIKLDNFNLNYDEFYVRNWTIEDSLTPTSKLGGTLKSHIDSIELATDIAITDISFLMPHTINSLVVTNLKGKLLNGSIEIPKLAVNESGIPPFTTYLKAIDINALLTALNSEKLKLTGRFDFALPLTLSGKGQQITDGTFKALGEGVVQLKSDKGKEANIAFQALENFHYKEFSGSLNYNLEGDYVVELHVLGSNPDVYNGFPIKLDLTLRGQLPELLYSMIVSGDMTKPILDDLQQKQILNIQP